VDRSRKFAWPTAALVTALVCACSNTLTNNTPTGTVAVTLDKATVTNDGTKINVTATAVDASNKPGTGSVVFTAAYGDFNASGNPTATVTLDATGTAKATYDCNVATTPKCVAGPLLIGAAWDNLSGTAVVALAAPAGTTTTTDGGTTTTDGGTTSTDGGTTTTTPTASKLALSTLFPAYVIVSSAANATDLPGTATATFVVSDQNGAPFKGASVSFVEQPGESLVTVGTSPAITDANGNVTVTVTGKTVPGTAHLVATLAGQPAVVVPVPVIGAPVVIVETHVEPASTGGILGLKGSGLFETGQMTFLVTDSFGTPVPGVTVNFTQNQPAILTILNTGATGSTDATGKVVASYDSGPDVGVSAIVATVLDTGAKTQQAVAVRGAKPSASGFSFKCSHVNLGTYDTTLGYDTTSCTVRLSDRYNNRVGIPAQVSFATEAGSITATATTQPFNFASPTDPNEGSVTVTFSSNTGNGFHPLDVTPLTASAAQVPHPRVAEPCVTSVANAAAAGCVGSASIIGTNVYNPRDQLVTIIAMVRGEEAFTDTNLDGVYDTGEPFVDSGDPFIDANDNGVYDSDEVRFCGGSDCALGGTSTSYHAGNGSWDADKIIWQPTWVVLSGAGIAMTPASLGCIDYLDNSVGNPISASANVYALDQWLNPPVAGTTYVPVVTPTPAPGNLTIATSGLFTELENWGAMGQFGSDFDYVQVGASAAACPSGVTGVCPDATKTCSVANGCMEKLLFYNFDNGLRGAVTVSNTATLPAALSKVGNGCTPPAASAGTKTEGFGVQLTETGGPVVSGTFTFFDQITGTAAF